MDSRSFKIGNSILASLGARLAMGLSDLFGGLTWLKKLKENVSQKQRTVLLKSKLIVAE